MSRTEKRNGERVFKAAMKLAKSREGFAYGMVMVGEVAALAEVSNPSARKYLDLCVTAGFAEVAKFGGSPLLVYKFNEVE